MLTTTTAELAGGLAVVAVAGFGSFTAHRLSHTSAGGRHPNFAAANGPQMFKPAVGTPRRGRRRKTGLARPRRARGGGGRRAALAVIAGALTYWAGGVYLHATSDVSLLLVVVVVIALLWVTKRRRT